MEGVAVAAALSESSLHNVRIQIYSPNRMKLPTRHHDALSVLDRNHIIASAPLHTLSYFPNITDTLP